MRGMPRRILAFIIRHELAIGSLLFALWLLAVVFGDVRKAGGVTVFSREVVWSAVGFGLFMLLREWGPYRAARMQFREERRAQRRLLAEADPARLRELRELMTELERGGRGGKR